MSIDVTDATFETEVLERSHGHPVVVDLWAPWCGPCRTLGPILETTVEETAGAVELVKVNVDENPQVAAAFQVQSIPAVYALHEGKVVDGFIGALPESQVRDFVTRVGGQPTEIDLLVEKGDEASLRDALELQSDHAGAVVALATLLVGNGAPEEALALLGRIPESAETRHVAALARLREHGEDEIAPDELAMRLDALLERVRGDDAARQEFVDLLETISAEDPLRAVYRRALSARLF